VKILVLTNLYPPHHAGTYDLRCQQVVEALRLRGHDLRILTSNHGLLTEQRDAEIERCLQLNGAFGHAATAGFREMLALEQTNHGALRQALTEFQPNLVHVWSLRGLSKSLITALRDSQVPTVFDVADDWLARELKDDPWLRWWNRPGANLVRASLELSGQRNRFDATTPTRLMRGLDRVPELFGKRRTEAHLAPSPVTACRFDRIYFCSEALKVQAGEAGFQVSHAEVIYPGISTQTFFGEVKPIGHPVKKLLVVTRLADGSGVMTALQALRSVREIGVKVTLSIYGRGESEYVSKLRSFAVQHQLPVEFLTVSDQSRDLAAVYQRHDALLYTPEWEEPFAQTPLEAMACGLPVIGAKLGGGRELLRHGENALTFTSGDALELASRIQEIQLQPALVRQMTETAQAEVSSNFHETGVIDRIETYLNQSLEVGGQA
jgi:glycogen(starch) synthase